MSIFLEEKGHERELIFSMKWFLTMTLKTKRSVQYRYFISGIMFVCMYVCLGIACICVCVVRIVCVSICVSGVSVLC